MCAHLCIPTKRFAHYGRPLNVARYLIDLHDASAVFRFCGSLMFQLHLSPKLREHLEHVARAESSEQQQPVVSGAQFDRLALIPNYTKTADADNVCILHGREVRQVDEAAGGMGCVLQLSLANSNDPNGWTKQEVGDYNGWAHDSRRPWRKGDQLEREGFAGFKAQFGNGAYALHHRFYLHFDQNDQIWLAAEDGCEGEPVQ